MASLFKDRETRPMVAMNFHKPHLVEHFKDLFWALARHPVLQPLPVYPVSSPVGRPEAGSPLRWFEEKFGLKVGESLVPYPWLSLIKPGVIVEASVSPLKGLFKGIPKILSYHNLATLGFGKLPERVKDIGDYDFLFLTGPLQKEFVTRAHRRYGGRLPRMLEVGYLRGDRLLARKNTFDRAGFLASLGLEDKPIVMYAPTWGEFSSAKEWLDHVVWACKMLDVNLLVRLHPLMLYGRNSFETGGVSWRKRLDGLVSPGVRVIMDDDIDDCLLAAQVLVTDVSSVGMDFMLLGRPVVFLPAPRFFRVFGEDFPITRFRDGKEVESREALLAELKDSLGGRDPGVSPGDVVYNPGRALEVMVDFLEGMLLRG